MGRSSSRRTRARSGPPAPGRFVPARSVKRDARAGRSRPWALLGGGLLAFERVGPVLAVGHSYGGCLALEFAARRPGLVAGRWLYKPPSAPVDPPPVFRSPSTMSPGGQPRRVDGPDAVWPRKPSCRPWRRRAPTGSLARRLAADPARRFGRARRRGAQRAGPGGARRDSVRFVVATGTASPPVYAAIAEAIEAFAARSGWTGLEPARLDPDLRSGR